MAEAKEVKVLVESQPAGGLVVVDGRPVGTAPHLVAVPVNSRGFVQRPVSVRVRFVDEPSTQPTSTEMRLTPLERAPARISFTPAGARRLGALGGS